MANTVLVTGANGFVGSHIVDALLREGYNVRAMVRTTSDLTFLEHKPVELAYGSVDDPASLREAVKRVHCIVHNAGVISAADPYLYYYTNSEGTHNLIKAVLSLRRKHPPRFLLISSQAAGGPSGTRWKREDDPRAPITAYGRSKLLAETIVHKYSDRLPVTIVRPPSVYGPRDRAFLPFFELVARGVMPVFGRGRLVSFTHVQDLARQVVVQLEHENAVGGIFNAAPFPPASLAEFGETIAAVLGENPRRIPVPDALLRYGYPVVHPLFTLFGIDPPFQPDKLPDLLAPRWTLDGSKAADRLGFEGRLPLLAGLGQTAEWYRWKKWLKTRRDRLRENGRAKTYMRPISNTMRLYDESCDLCALAFDREAKTKVHYEDGDFIIVDCLICRVPMAVLKEHRARFTESERRRIVALFRELFGYAEPDFEQRRIPDHAHVHYRKGGHAPPWTRRPEETAHRPGGAAPAGGNGAATAATSHGSRAK